MTTMIEEYFELYKKHQKEVPIGKVVVLMQVGKFYEAYENDSGNGCAKLVSEVLQTQLTKTKKKQDLADKNPYMTGFPKPSLVKYLTRLNDLGYTVYLYDQKEGDAKCRFFRGKYTPSIRMDFTEHVDSTENQSMTTIFSYMIEKYPVQNGKIRYYEYEQHFCWLETHTGKIFFSESKDSSFERMFEQFLLQNQPSTLLFYTYQFEEEEKNKMKQILEKHGKHSTLLEWKLHPYEYMENTMNVSFSQPPLLDMYPLMMNCLTNLLDYIKQHDRILISHLYVSEDSWVAMNDTPYLQFNRDLVKELFLFSVDESRQKENYGKCKTLYDILSKSMNVMGRRYLRRILQRPLTDAKEIRERYQQLENIDGKQKIFYASLVDMEWYYLRWRRGTLSTRHLSTLLSNYKLLSEKYQELQPFNDFIDNIWCLESMKQDAIFHKTRDSDFIHWNTEYQAKKQKLEDFEEKEIDINLVFDDEDIYNSYFSTTIRKFNKWTTKKQNEYRILGRTSTIIKLATTYTDRLFSDLFELKSKMTKFLQNLYSLQCESIWNNFDHTLRQVHDKVMKNSAFCVLKDFFEKNGYTHPEVQQDSTFSLDCKNVRHAIIESIFPDDLFVPFSVQLSHDAILGKVIYGVNSSGKSTFMKSIALALWMAHCGLWVPACSFSFVPLQSMFSKFSHADNLYRGQSLFISEMSELRYMMEHSNKKTFLLMDELTSGTEVHSSSSLIIALLEEFLHQNIYFLFTTHIHWIANYLKRYKDRLDICHFEMNHDRNVLLANDISEIFNRKLQNGAGPSLYGLEVAEQLGISSRVTDRAYQIRNHVRFDYTEENTMKLSKYNPKLSMEECFRCGERKHLHTHHIFPQKNFQDGKQEKNGYRKNALYNLIVLCEHCHHSVHHEDVVEMKTK